MAASPFASGILPLHVCSGPDFQAPAVRHVRSGDRQPASTTARSVADTLVQVRILPPSPNIPKSYRLNYNEKSPSPAFIVLLTKLPPAHPQRSALGAQIERWECLFNGPAAGATSTCRA